MRALPEAKLSKFSTGGCDGLSESVHWKLNAVFPSNGTSPWAINETAHEAFVHFKTLLFSIGGKYYTGEPVQFEYTADTVIENARNVSIKLDHQVGRYIKVILTFASRWMMISEVSFESGKTATDLSIPPLNHEMKF